MKKKTIITFLMGVTTSLVATFIWWSVSNITDNRFKQLQNLNGYWLEEIPKSPDRRYSIGKFYYDKESKSYQYDGVNYTNDGQPFCTWESTSFDVDFTNKRIYYIFEASIKDELYNVNYGFGVVNYECIQNKIVPTTGFYRETLMDAEPYCHDFKKLDDIITLINYQRNRESIDDFHSKIVKLYHQKIALKD